MLPLAVALGFYCHVLFVLGFVVCFFFPPDFGTVWGGLQRLLWCWDSWTAAVTHFCGVSCLLAGVGPGSDWEGALLTVQDRKAVLACVPSGSSLRLCFEQRIACWFI